jgi:hypothetical protein
MIAGEAGLDAVVRSIKLEDDEAYFSSYAHFGIHHEMLSVSSAIKS